MQNHTCGTSGWSLREMNFTVTVLINKRVFYNIYCPFLILGQQGPSVTVSDA